MMIGAFARGSRILDNSELLVEAVKTANFLQQHLYNRKTKSLQRRYRNGESGLDGQLDDYTYLADGLLELYQATHDPRWLIWSHDLTQQQISLFWNATAGYFYDSVADPSIKVRMRERYDGATPTGNSVAVHNLLRLGMLYKKPEWSKMAQRLLQSFAEIINGIPTALPTMLTALQQIDEKPVQVVIAGVKGAGDTKKLLDVVNSSYDPGRLLLLADGAENQKYLAEKLSFMDTVSTINNKATAYVCYDFTCKLPVNEAAALQQQLALQNTTRP